MRQAGTAPPNALYERPPPRTPGANSTSSENSQHGPASPWVASVPTVGDTPISFSPYVVPHTLVSACRFAIPDYVPGGIVPTLVGFVKPVKGMALEKDWGELTAGFQSAIAGVVHPKTLRSTTSGPTSRRCCSSAQ